QTATAITLFNILRRPFPAPHMRRSDPYRRSGAAALVSQAARPRLGRSLALRRLEEVLEGHVQEGGARLGEHLVAVADLRRDPEAPSALARQLGLDEQLRVDVHRAAI